MLDHLSTDVPVVVNEEHRLLIPKLILKLLSLSSITFYHKKRVTCRLYICTNKASVMLLLTFFVMVTKRVDPCMSLALQLHPKTKFPFFVLDEILKV